MPNKNYLAGRRLEYEVMKEFENRGFKVLRTSGSHGEFDVVAYKLNEPPLFIQCKRVTTLAEKKAWLRKWEPTVSSTYVQVLAVKVKGSSEINYIHIGGIT